MFGSCSFFFFQAEDGIRDHCVTGVQTCALPISESRELDAAADEYLFLLRYAPDSALLHNDYGNVLVEQRRLDQAMTEYNEAIRLDPSLSAAHDNLGTCLTGKKNLE